jgi:hypothetical protein
MKRLVIALALSLVAVAPAFAQAPTNNSAPARVNVSFEPPTMQTGPGNGFTVFGSLGLGIQHDTYFPETATGLAGVNFGVGMFLNDRLAVLGRLSGTSVSFDEAGVTQFSGVLGGSVQYWLNHWASVEGGLGMGFWSGEFDDGEQDFGLIAAFAASVWQRGSHHIRVAFEYAPVFTEFAIHNMGFTVGYQFIK